MARFNALYTVLYNVKFLVIKFINEIGIAKCQEKLDTFRVIV